MTRLLHKVRIWNYRSLEEVELNLNHITVLFGPNGAGKTSFLDAIWFLSDCAQRGVDVASSNRGQGIGLLWDKANTNTKAIDIYIETELSTYHVIFNFSSGRIEPFVQEFLYSKLREKMLIERAIASDKVTFHTVREKEDSFTIELREPKKLSVRRYLDFQGDIPEATEIESALYQLRHYHARSIDLDQLRTHGSEANTYTRLYDRCENLWSVLRNLKERQELGDKRYGTIVTYMQKAFPTFSGLFLEQTGANSVYGNFVETDRSQPIHASRVSDGHLQLLTHLTALFSEDLPTFILFDEPETSLHPHALTVLAEAIKEATTDDWNKQIALATHSPVLMSQFDAENIIAVEKGSRGETTMQYVSDMENIEDLLQEYAVGSLYMAELIAPQSKLDVE